MSYAWGQLSGPSVPLTNSDTLTPSFVAPDDPATLTLVVTDTVRIVVENQAPTVDAGPDQTVATLSEVTLNGSASDPDGDALSYEWVQLSGPSVSLSDTQVANPSFTAPEVSATLVFELTVTDSIDAMVTDTVTITVEHPTFMVFLPTIRR